MLDSISSLIKGLRGHSLPIQASVINLIAISVISALSLTFRGSDSVVSEAIPLALVALIGIQVALAVVAVVIVGLTLYTYLKDQRRQRALRFRRELFQQELEEQTETLTRQTEEQVKREKEQEKRMRKLEQRVSELERVQRLEGRIIR